jgi:hypothetical protein
VIGPLHHLDAPTMHLYKPISERGYRVPSTPPIMDAEGIDIAVV